MVRRARRPLASSVEETWTCATASPTLLGLKAALSRSTPTAYHEVSTPRSRSLQTPRFNRIDATPARIKMAVSHPRMPPAHLLGIFFYDGFSHFHSWHHSILFYEATGLFWPFWKFFSVFASMRQHGIPWTTFFWFDSMRIRGYHFHLPALLPSLGNCSRAERK